MEVTTTPFQSIVCGVEGNPSSAEAARQAVALAEPGAELHFITVHTSRELGPDNHRDHLEQGLERAGAMARESGVQASTDMREAQYAAEVLLEESREHDLLVVGTHGNSRASGMVFGSTASKSAHETNRPLLVARRPPGDAEFPRNILLASDGTEGSWAPAKAAGRIAAAFDAKLEVFHVDDGKHPEGRGVLEKEAEELTRMTGVEPDVSQVSSHHPVQSIIDRATDRGAALIVCGRRGLRGIKSLGSVSERVVHGADCSVLLVPAHD
jgi:nucleotide-binding universal stress UspA family protein